MHHLLCGLAAVAMWACASTTKQSGSEQPTTVPNASAAAPDSRLPTPDSRVVPDRDQRMEAFIDSVLAGLTLEEKLGQLNQPGTEGVVATGPQARTAGEAEIRAGKVGSFLSVNGAELTRRLQRIAVEESRAKIPLLFGHDVIHGFRTIFPIPLAEASSWDTAAVRRAAHAAAVEATAYGVNWTYAPMVDIARDPRWGRIMEGSGEDPYLGSAMAVARVRGFQGDDLADPTTLLATAKHFAVYGAAEAGRDYNVADISERTLREVYLPPFEAAVRAGVGSVMASFNEVAGVPMHANAELINGVLRREWGWDGLLVSDYTGITELIPHGVAADSAQAAALALRAGVDIDMISRAYPEQLPRLLRQGAVSQAMLDDAVRRVLRAKYRLGLFDDPYRYSDTARERSRTMTPEAIAEARDMARKSIVLLKNAPGPGGRPVLPLRKDLGTIAVIGPLADDSGSALGGWAARGRPEDAVTVLAGIRSAAPRARVVHARGADHEKPDTSGIAAAVRAARQADAVVLVVGEHRDMSGEARSRTSLDLPGVQQRLVEAVHATGKPVVVVLMNGRPLAIPWIAEHVPAIVEAWYLGVQMGPAVADVLFGDYNPSGKLPVTFPRNVGQVPIYYSFKQTGRPPDPKQPYTHRDYTSKYIDVPSTPLFPFGHGLSYTTFAYDNLQASAPRIRRSDSLSVRVDVTNAGDRGGDEVVQLYIRDEVGSVTRPMKELRGFRRVTLRPKERRTVAFTLRPEDLAMYGPDMKRVVEPGFFTVFVGTSSANTRQTRFEVIE